MKSIVPALLFVFIAVGSASADWQLYWNGNQVKADFDYLSREPFRGKPSIWVKWFYTPARKGIGGIKIQFTADCASHELYEIASVPFDTEGNFLAMKKNYDSPKRYEITPHSLNEATYGLMCE